MRSAFAASGPLHQDTEIEAGAEAIGPPDEDHRVRILFCASNRLEERIDHRRRERVRFAVSMWTIATLPSRV